MGSERTTPGVERAPRASEGNQRSPRRKVVFSAAVVAPTANPIQKTFACVDKEENTCQFLIRVAIGTRGPVRPKAR